MDYKHCVLGASIESGRSVMAYVLPPSKELYKMVILKTEIQPLPQLHWVVTGQSSPFVLHSELIRESNPKNEWKNNWLQ